MTIALIFFVLIPWLKQAGFCEIFTLAATLMQPEIQKRPSM